MESRSGRIAIRVFSWLVIAFIYVPLLIVAMYAFSGSVGQKWPIEEYTTRWFGVAWRNGIVRDAIVTSVETARPEDNRRGGPDVVPAWHTRVRRMTRTAVGNNVWIIVL